MFPLLTILINSSIMKRSFLLITIALSYCFSYSQTDKQIDSAAVFILDKMSDIIGDLEAVSFKVESSVDDFDINKNIITHYRSSTVSMVGPDKLVAVTKGDKGNYGFWYDGYYMSYYSYDENNYVTLEAPDNIITMIDSMHVAYGFKFPAADFFYPSFTDDLIQDFDSIEFKGKRTINNQDCFYITAVSQNLNLQLWISDGALQLPKKFILIFKNEDNKQYEATFNNWNLNPNIPSSVFDFVPPPNSKLISIMAKS